MLLQKDRLILTDEKQKELLSNYLDSFCLCELYEDQSLIIGRKIQTK